MSSGDRIVECLCWMAAAVAVAFAFVFGGVVLLAVAVRIVWPVLLIAALVWLGVLYA